MPLSLVGDGDADPLHNRILADLSRANGLASPGRIAERVGASPDRVEAALRDLVRQGLVRTCRYTDGAFYELIPNT